MAAFSLSFALFLFSSASCAMAQSPPIPPALVHVPLQLSPDNQRYIAGTNMSHGDNSQRFGFALSTTTGYTIVADVSCTECASKNISTYNPAQSTSAAQVGSGQQQQVVGIGGGALNTQGTVAREDCALHQANGSYWQYPNQTIVKVDQPALFQPGVSGVVGLGTNAPFDDTIFSGWLARNPTQINITFGLALNPPPVTPGQNIAPATAGGDSADAGASAGTLHMLQPDPLSYTGDMTWYNTEPANTGSANSSEWASGAQNASSWIIQMDGWNFESGTAKASNAAGGQATVEPYFSSIFLPNAQAVQLYASLQGAAAIAPATSAIGQSFTIPCDANFTFSVVLGGQEYPVPKDVLVLQNTDGTCVGAIEGWADTNITGSLLGSRFISTYYMAFQVGRPPAVEQKIGIANRAIPVKDSSSHVGAIVGGTIGGVVFGLLVGAGLFWWLRRRTHRPAVVLHSEHDGSSEHAYRTSARMSQGHDIGQWGAGPPYTPSPAPAPVPRTLTTPEPYYISPINHSIPPDQYAYPQASPPLMSESAYPLMLSPTSTVSENGLAFPPRVNQWVRNMRPISEDASGNVPTHYDYGNQGEPGQPARMSEDESGNPARHSR